MINAIVIILIVALVGSLATLTILAMVLAYHDKSELQRLKQEIDL